MQPDQFARVWNSAGSRAEAARRLGMTVGSCAVRACRLRKSGRRLKQYRRTPRPVDREVFARVWRASRSVREVARRLDIHWKLAYRVAAELRRAGVNLGWPERVPKRGRGRGE